ncbi:MAG: GNAT family N-acetyltransferase [Chloroflexota bacterium]
MARPPATSALISTPRHRHYDEHASATARMEAARHNGTVVVAAGGSSRPWASREDTRALQRLASARLAIDWPAVRFHPGDLDWWALQADDPLSPLPERVRLWLGPDGKPVAYAWFSPPADLDFLIGPSDTGDDPGRAAGLIPEILAWAEERRITIGHGVEPLRAWIAAEDRLAMGAVAAAGFHPEARPGYVQFTGDLMLADGWPAPALATSLGVRELRTDDDIAARVACGRAAFPRSTMTIERYRRSRDAWLYRPELDLQIVTGDGVVAAFALGWLDAATGSVELEPVGVHPDWHRQGLGGEICRAALRVARGLGATRAMVASERANDAALGLYSSLGLEITTEIVAFTNASIESTAPTAFDPATS